MALKVGKKEYGPGSYKAIEKDLKITLAEEEKPIVDYWAGGDTTFDDAQDVKDALKYLTGCWDKQKLFYGKSNFDEWKGTASVATAPTLYSGRPLAAGIALYHWAKAKGIPVTVEGRDPFSTSADPGIAAPFKGHFGDRVQTLKHLKQKQSSGGDVCLVMIQLNKNGVAALKAVSKIADGGEGYTKGSFGFKHEKGSVSVGISDAKETWDFVATRIAKITLRTMV
jgi:hypothetical protein